MAKQAKCIEWPGTTRGGYGVVSKNRRWVGVHRIMVEFKIGRPLRAGELPLHKCDNPRCVNPPHLFVGTQSDNMRDMYAKGRSPNVTTKECRNGHRYTPETTVYRAGMKTCRLCTRESQRRYREKKGKK